MALRVCRTCWRRCWPLQLSPNGASPRREKLNMPVSEPMRVGFVVKRYPRYSETFIVNEIIAHEQAGLAIEIFALRPPNDTHFQDVIARVRAPVNCLFFPAAEAFTAETPTADVLGAAIFWNALEKASEVLP